MVTTKPAILTSKTSGMSPSGSGISSELTGLI